VEEDDGHELERWVVTYGELRARSPSFFPFLITCFHAPPL